MTTESMSTETAARGAPLVEMRDVNLTWYVGLDAEGTRIGDALWNGEEIEGMSARDAEALEAVHAQRV